MPLTFQRAPVVSPGDPVTSNEWRLLAKAFNDRLPYFDFAWRIAFYVFSLFRAMRNSSPDGTRHAPWAEFFHSYQGLEPGQGDWPVSGPGDPEGANLANPLNAYIWGNPNLYNEAERFADVPMTLPDGRVPETAEELWWLHVRQCGAVDLDSGVADSPAWLAARSWYLTYQGPRSPHGNSYGGYLPSPVIIGQCQDPNDLDGIPAPPNYEVTFTATAAGLAAGLADKVYPGVCPIGPSTTADYSGHVWGLWRTPWAYYVLLNDGTLDTLPRNYYVEGPYSGPPVLRKTEGGQLIRALNAFVAQHRGIRQNQTARSAVEAGAADPPEDWLHGAFDLQAFLTSDYPLAPLRGGATSTGVAPIIPTAIKHAGSDLAVLAGTMLEHTVWSGCVVNYVLVKALAPAERIVVRVSGGGRTWRVDVWPGQESLMVPVSIAAGETCRVEVENHARFREAHGYLEVRLAEAMAYRPDISDAILVQRLTGDPGSGSTLDASAWLAGLRASGCALNRDGQETVQTPFHAITRHPAYEAARLWSRCVRLLPADSVVGYAVEQGKSCVWLKRRAQWTGSGPTKTEVFEGTGSIVSGREYVVDGPAGQVIWYGSNSYSDGEHFVGLAGLDDFTAWPSSARVFEVSPGAIDPLASADGLSGIAERVDGPHGHPRAGAFSNRWVIGFDFKARHPSPSSIWKEDAYGNIFAFNDRATFYSPEIANEITKHHLWHVAFGQRVPGAYGGNVISESPSGYRYAPLGSMPSPWSGRSHVNQILVPSFGFPDDDARQRFHKSCRIYEPALEIESAEAVTEGGVELVKITLTGRLQSTTGEPGGAAASISREVGSWDMNALQAEPYQTTERALRTHVARLHTGRNFLATYGDHAANSSIQTLSDNPFATDFPLVWMVKMIPEPREDGNDGQDGDDTPLYHDAAAQMETYLRAMCEACVDQQQSLAKLLEQVRADEGILPSSWGLHDYDFQELCRQAFGGAWIGPMPTEATAWTPDSHVRPDDPHGFGPMPNTLVSSEVFNRLSKAVNLLTRFRVMLPFVLERKERWWIGTRPETLPFACNYPGGMTYGHLDGVHPPPARTLFREDEEWVEDTGAVARAGFLLEGCDWFSSQARVDVQWRVTWQNGIENAMPPYVRELWDADQVGLLCWYQRTLTDGRRTEVPYGTPGSFSDAGGGKSYIWPPYWHNVQEEGPLFITQGTITPPELVVADCGYYYSGVGDPDSAGGSQSSMSIGLVPGQTAFVEVPLAD